MGATVNSNNRSGFTLIEFCFAVLIMMVGLMGLLQAINMATLHNLGTVLRNEAISLADENMVLTKTFSQSAGVTKLFFNTDTFAIRMASTAQANDLELYSGSPTPYDSMTPNSTVSVLTKRKTRSGFCNYSVVRTISSAGSNSKEVAVRVSWRYKGSKLSHVISSLITNPNPL
jgi:type IV pilus assembly protein PilV